MFKAPKIDQSPKKNGNIVYPHVSTWDIFYEYIKLSKPYAWLAVTVFLASILATILQSITVPIFYKKFFDELTSMSGITSPDISSLNQIIIYILIINIIVWAVWRVYNICINYLQAYVRRDAYQKSFDHVLEHSHSFFINNFSGSLVQRIGRFSRSYETLFDKITYELLTLVIKVIGTMFVLYLVNPIFTYGMLVWVGLFLMISYFFTKYKLKFDVEAAAVNSKVTGMASDAMSNHASIQAFSASMHETHKMEKIITYHTELSIFRENLDVIQNTIQSFLVLSIEFFIFYVGIKYWHLGLISIGTFVLAQSYILNLNNSLWGFGRIIRSVYEAVADAKEMVEMIKLPYEIADVPNARPLTVPHGVIEFKNVGFYFGKKEGEGKKVFENLNISIKSGEKVALIGTSGAGKSTLVKLLTRLHDIQQGEILIDGQNIKNVTQKSLRENISLVPQDPSLFHRALLENIRYGKLEATNEEVVRAAKLAHCDVFINELPQKYETLVGERGVKLSGGERQRVAIARAILKNAPILILDEATSSLDSHSEALIQDALHTLMEGKTTIVIAHRLSTIRKMDRIIVVSKGGVVEEGTHDELIKKEGGIYAKLWSLQAGGFENKSIEELLEE
jgi:ATP-binding cassette subfamily B protein